MAMFHQIKVSEPGQRSHQNLAAEPSVGTRGSSALPSRCQRDAHVFCSGLCFLEPQVAKNCIPIFYVQMKKLLKSSRLYCIVKRVKGS